MISNFHDASFRADINGLRAVAVLAVVAFHFGITPFSGGFIGVDVFFVISGFLMTQILVQNPDILSFYGKRVARIVPAHSATILATLIITSILLLPAHYSLVAKQALASALFFVNFHFASSVGYFDPAAETSWFLHFWSLAVEIQFYLVFPLYVWIARRLGVNALYALLLLAVCSFVAACFQSDTRDGFYLPHYRFWEFAAGGVVALLPSLRSQIASYTGFVLIVLAVLWFKAGFGAASLVVPVLGAALILWSSTDIWPISHPFMQRVGTISYSVYLWHWPVLLTARYMELEKGPVNVALLCILTLLIGAASHRWIETKFRPTGFNAICGVVPALLLALFAPAIQPLVMDPQIRALTQDAIYDGPRWRARSCFLESDQSFSDLDPACLKASGEKPKLLLWGDSITAALYPGVSSQPWTPTFDTLQVTASSCSVVGNLTASDEPRCGGIRKQMLEWIKQNKPEAVVITTAVNTCALNQESVLRDLVATLKNDGVSKIMVVGPGPIWNPPLPEIFYRKFVISKIIPTEMAPAAFNTLEQCDNSLRRTVPSEGVAFISLFDAMCHQGQCKMLLQTERGLALSHMDSFHLSRGGAFWVASRLIGPALMNDQSPP